MTRRRPRTEYRLVVIRADGSERRTRKRNRPAAVRDADQLRGDIAAGILAPYREDKTWASARSRLSTRFPFVLLMIAVMVGLDIARRRLRRWRSTT